MIVTSYALHHLKDTEKVALIRRAQIWLPPSFWCDTLRSADLAEVRYSTIRAEAGLVTARRP